MGRVNIFSASTQKILYFKKEVELWKSGGSFIPVTLEIQPSEQCTHHCPNCQSKFSLPRREIKQRAASGFNFDISLLEKIWNNPPQGIIISGNTGDPLMHPQIDVILEEIKKREIPCILITNGDLLDERIMKLAIQVCRGIRISLDAWDPESYRRSHGVSLNAWQEIIAKLFRLAEIKKELQATHCQIGAGFLTGEKSRDGMLQATRIVKSTNIDYIQFRPYHYDTTVIDMEIEQCLLEETDRFQVYLSDQKYIHLKTNQRKHKRCHGAFFYTTIDARGDMYICCHHIGKDSAKLGNLHTQSWEALCLSKERVDFINNFSVENCMMRCRLYAHNESLHDLLDANLTDTIDDQLIIDHAPFL